jgi:hypothetical protein
MAKRKKDGSWNVTMDKIEPAQLKAEIDKLSSEHEKLKGRKITFSPDADIMTDPDAVAAWLFGQGVKAKDIMTAEQVIAQIKKRKDARTILADAASSLKEAGLPVPKEITGQSPEAEPSE